MQDLESLNTLAIPKVVEDSENPPYLVISFVSGETISAGEINQWPKDQQKRFAEQLAQFAFAVHSMLPVQKVKEDKEEVGMSDFDFYDYALSNFNFPTPQQDKIAKYHYRSWKNMKYGGPKIVIHNDLNTANLLFKNNRLVGVIDFGDTRVGFAEQELRQLYRINEIVLQTAIKRYEQLAGYKLNMEAIKVNAIVQELAAYADKLSTNNLTHPGFLRAKKHLEQWFPDCNWDPNAN